MRYVFFFLATLVALPLFAQQTFRTYLKDQVTYREHPLDILHMKVTVKFEPEKGKVIGKVDHRFTTLQQRVDSVFFDAPGISIEKVMLNQKEVAFNTTAAGVWVKPAQPLKWDQEGVISFVYTATPRKGIYFIGWNAPENKERNPYAVRKQIWTQGQGIDNRYWIPMYDDMNDKFITETEVTFDAAYEVLSNGVLKKKTKNKDNTITWQYAMSKPHAGYLLMLGIGKYAIKQSKSGRGVPLRLYYYPEFADRAEPTYRYSEKMVDFLERETGIAYPWESYSQIMVQDFLYGAMENTTATIFGDFFNVDERAYIDKNYVGVNCHELTHQWFGDYITARDVRDTWLQESYATYYPKMFTKEIYGEDEYNWQRRGEQNAAIEASKKDRNPIRHSQAGSTRFYPKGSNVISMLSYVLGDEQWKRALNHYLKTHAYANVETNDLQQAIQDRLGKDLSWFFDQWIYKGGEPEYTVKYEDVMKGDGSRRTEIYIAQTHKRDEAVGLFTMPIVCEVHYADGSVDKETVWMDEANETVSITNKAHKEIAYVLFDPNSMVLKTVKFDKTLDELEAQALTAPFMLDRYDAVVAMRSLPMAQKKEVLLSVLAKEPFHQVKAEVIAQLIKETDGEVVAALQQAMNTRHTSVKIALLKGYNGSIASWKPFAENALRDSSYEVVQVALEKLCLAHPDEAARYLKATAGIDGYTNGLMVKWHELSIQFQYQAEESKKRLVYLSSNAWEFRTRNNAFAALKSVGYCDAAVVGNIFDAVLSTNSRLATPASQLAEYFSQQLAYKKLFETQYQSRKWESWQQEQLKRYLAFLF